MAIESQYTGIGRVPYVTEQPNTNFTDFLEFLSNHKDKEDAKDFQREQFEADKEYKQGQLSVAQERNQIAKMEFEKKKQDENEVEDLRVAQSMTNWQDRVTEYKKLGEKYGKDSYLRMAEQMETDGIAKDEMSTFKNNMYNEDNPYKIDEYLRRDGESLQKYYPGAFEYLNKRSTDLKKQYSTSDAAVQNSQEYAGYLNQIKSEMGEPGMFNTNKATGEQYTMEEYNAALAQARMNSAQAIQAPLIQAGIMPTDDANMDKIWENPEAREAYFANPLDNVQSIMEQYNLVEEKDGDGDGDNGDPPPNKIQKLEVAIKAYEDAGLTNISGYEEKKKELKLLKTKAGRTSDEKKLDDKIAELSKATGENPEKIREELLNQIGTSSGFYSPGLMLKFLGNLSYMGTKISDLKPSTKTKKTQQAQPTELTSNQERKIRTNLSRIQNIENKNYSSSEKSRRIKKLQDEILAIDPNYKFNK